MSTIVSPTTTERKLRTLGLLVLFGGAGAWFYYDGTRGWPAENLKKAVESLDPVPDELPPIHPGVTRQTIEEWLAAIADQRVTRADVRSRFGEPGWERAPADGKPGEMWYFGPGGALKLVRDGELIVGAEYVKGRHDDSELALQVYLAVGLLPLVLVIVIQLVRVLTTRVVLSEAGLKVRGRPMVPFEAMTDIDASRYRKKGFLDLRYTRDGARKAVRLDDYVIRDFRPIVSEICVRCGFPNPLPPAPAASAHHEERSDD